MAPSEHRPGPLLRRVLRTPARLYDWNAGWLLGRRFLRLTHVGRRSGRRYRTVLEVIGTGPAPGEVIVIAGLGRSANWYRNLQAHPAVELAARAEGIVWQLARPAGSPPPALPVIAVAPAPSGTGYRVLAPSSPGPDAQAVEPTVEDGYVALMHHPARQC